jgi:hypothetical protein
MEKTLTSLENLTQFLYTEINRVKNIPELEGGPDLQSFKILKEAAIQAIDLKRKIELAQAYSLTNARCSHTTK